MCCRWLNGNNQILSRVGDKKPRKNNSMDF